MPPKAKFSKQQIIDASINIVRESGFKSLTARNLANELDSSPRPIFTLYSSMDEVNKDTIKAIIDLYKSYSHKGITKEQPFKGSGEAYIQFAIDEPKLFQILFMSERKEPININKILPIIDDEYQSEINLIKNEYDLNDKDAEFLYLHLWIYTHGIATLCATKVASFTSTDISNLLSDVFISLMNKIKHKKSEEE